MEDRKFRRTAEREKNKFMPLEIKDMDDRKGEVAFYFAAWGLDRDGDIMKKSAYPKTIKENFKNIYHNVDHREVCGVIKSLEVDERGAFCVSQMSLKTDIGRNTYERYVAGEIKGHSQEFETLEFAYESIANNKKARVISDIRLWGVTSCTKIPANGDTPTIYVKTADEGIIYHMNSINDILMKGDLSELEGDRFIEEYLKMKALAEKMEAKGQPRPLITKEMVEKFSLK